MLCKIEDFKEKLPTPKTFTERGSIIISVDSEPLMFGDGFTLVVEVPKKHAEELSKRARQSWPIVAVKLMLSGVKEANLLLSEPKYICDTSFLHYITFTPKNTSVAMQVKYYNYFRKRYRNCMFYTSGKDRYSPVYVKVGNKLVGMIMPMAFDYNYLIKALSVGVKNG